MAGQPKRERGGQEVAKEVAIMQEAVRRWRSRRAALETELGKQPDSEWAWLWQTRLTVLGYLIDRYRQEAVDEQGCAPSRPRHVLNRVSMGLSSVVEETAPYDKVPAYAIVGNRFTDRSALRSRLHSLKSANAERHKEAEKLADELRRLNELHRSQRADEHNDLVRALGDMQRQAADERKQLFLDLSEAEQLDNSLDSHTIRLILEDHGIEPDDP
ncbi:MAG: hypothetical protein AAGB26_13095 [Planctomycetota bacterium]